MLQLPWHFLGSLTHDERMREKCGCAPLSRLFLEPCGSKGGCGSVPFTPYFFVDTNRCLTQFGYSGGACGAIAVRDCCAPCSNCSPCEPPLVFAEDIADKCKGLSYVLDEGFIRRQPQVYKASVWVADTYCRGFMLSVERQYSWG